MLTIHLHNLQFKSFHGLYAEEKILGNHFEVNLTVKYQPKKLPIQSIEQTINYQNVFEIVEQQMSTPTALLETLVVAIANEILKQFSMAKEVDICIAKKNPPIPNFIGNVAVSYQIKRRK
jgi:7,8-dihydroneopterin aldolase/epimerase/oxygenase